MQSGRCLINRIYPLSLIRVFALAVVLLAGGACAEGDDARDTRWRTCEQVSDCVVVGGGCVIGAVNKAHESEADEYFSDMSGRMECIRYMDPANFTVSCDYRKVFCGHDTTCVSAVKLCHATEKAPVQ